MSQLEKTFLITESDYPAIVGRVLRLKAEHDEIKLKLVSEFGDVYERDLEKTIRELNYILYGSDVEECPVK